jgi:hypothetical protein
LIFFEFYFIESSSFSGRRKVFCHLQSTQTIFEASPASYLVRAQGKVAGPGSKPLISVYCISVMFPVQKISPSEIKFSIHVITVITYVNNLFHVVTVV